MKQRTSRLMTTLGAAAVALLVAGCVGVTQGQAVSPLYDPFRAGGLPAEDGPSGVREDAPEPVGDVQYGDGGDVDRLALLAVNDVADYWEQHYPDSFANSFTPIDTLESWDANDPDSPVICGRDTYQLANASYCIPEESMAWDRGVLIPTGQEFFGDASVAALLGHEYGHAVQFMAELIDDSTSILVGEQQADCFAGNYIRWVAEGRSPRFKLSTGDGLNYVLAAAITLRDPTLEPGDSNYIEDGHGTALDRVSAFQIGFTGTPEECAEIDMADVEERRGDLPLLLPYDESSGNVQSGDLPLDEDLIQLQMDVLTEIFQPEEVPTLSFDTEECDDARPSPPASYCPATNTISVDVPGMEQLGQPGDREDGVLIQGDNTALSVLASRYALAVQKEKGLALDTATAALRTACLTGVAQAAMAEVITTPSGGNLTLTAGDFDEAVAGLLTNGLVASNVDGETVPAGFTRIIAFRSGLTGDADLCFNRFE